MADAEGCDLTLAFLIDALGYELAGRGGFLDRLTTVERPRIRSILGFSSGAIPTIFTGRFPAEHGHWAMYRRAADSSVFAPYRLPLRLADRLPRGQWWTRRWLTGRLRKDGLTGYFSLYEVPLRYLPLFDLCERRNIYRAGAFERIESLFDRLAKAGVPFRVWDWSVPTPRAYAEIESAIREGKERLLLLYTPELDETMHTHGPGSAATKSWLQSNGERIEAIVAIARKAGRNPRIRVFGDHGMARVHTHLDLLSLLQKLPARMPRDYVVFLDSTMARFWFHSDAARSQILDLLSGSRNGRFVPYGELTSLGVGFPDRAYGEEIFLVHPGVLILPSFMGSSPVLGMHGYHPEDRDSDTVLIADPMPERPPETILDIASILLEDLGVSREES